MCAVLHGFLEGLCTSPARETPQSSEQGKRDHESAGTVQLYAQTTSVSFGEEDVVFLEEAGEPCGGDLVFHPSLQCILIRLGLPNPYIFPGC